MSEDAYERLRRCAYEVRSARTCAVVHLREVKRFQAARLAQTHADFLSSSRYQAAACFFLDDLYGEKDFSQRDKDLARILPTMKRFLPESALAAIADAIELDALSERLDQEVARELEALGLRKGAKLSASMYAWAYCAVVQQSPTDADPRLRQIELMQQIGAQLARLVRQPLVSGLLRSMVLPAQSVGLADLHDFLSRGFAAFKAMGDAKEFISILVAKEKAHHESQLAAGTT